MSRLAGIFSSSNDKDSVLECHRIMEKYEFTVKSEYT